MEGIAPPLKLLYLCRRQLEKGESLRLGIKKYLESEKNHFRTEVAEWIFLIDSGRTTSDLLRRLQSPYRRQLLQTLEKGLRREPILTGLKVLEAEIIEACEIEIQNTMTTLPYKALLPLLLMVFPAFMMILLGPLLLQLLESTK